LNTEAAQQTQMAFLRTSPVQEATLGVYGRGVFLRPPELMDYAAWAELREASRTHLQPWEPEWADDELSRTAFRRRLRLYARDLTEDHGYAFFLFRSRDMRLLGGLTLSNVRRGVAQAGSIGYWIGEPFSGQGYMTEAVRAVAPFAFDRLRLHRLEAACLANNDASMRVLQKAGFQREGVARDYLKINGRWQDHVLFGMTENDTRLEVTL
jgi:[ribosomal protein S5]-alanine N-acetyltransferase